MKLLTLSPILITGLMVSFYGHAPGCKESHTEPKPLGNLVMVSAGCDVEIARAEVVDGAWVVSLKSGWSLLDLFQMIEATPTFPLLPALIRRIEAKGWKGKTQTTKPAVIKEWK